MDLAEIFLNVPLSAQTHLCSETATNLLIVRWSCLRFREISNVFIPHPRQVSEIVFSDQKSP
ncbi:unnamed protein product, partial [Staurois parvus]